MISKWISRLLLLGIAGACTGLLIGFFGWLHPAFDTFAHFRLHLAGGLLLCAAVCLVMARPVKMIVCLLAGLVGLTFSVSGTRLIGHSNAVLPDRPVYTMLHLNLQFDHGDPESVIRLIKELDPDLLSLSETFNVWTGPLTLLESRWPHFGECRVVGGQSGVSIYSKFPLDQSEDYCGPYGSFLKTGVILEGQKRIDFGSVHPRWPWPASGPEQYAAFQPALAALQLDALIAGDFNATPWSHAVRQFLANGQLELAAGIGPSWLFSEFPESMIRWVGLPIDHVMARGRVRVLSAQSLEPAGSDHLPLWVEFQIE